MNTTLLRVGMVGLLTSFGSTPGFAQDSVENSPRRARSAQENGSTTADASVSGGQSVASTSLPPVVIIESVEALQEKIRQSRPGDTLVLKNGRYLLNSTLSITGVGTAERPITIAAESVGGVELAGPQGIKVAPPAEHVSIAGFRFTHAAGKTSIAEGTRYVRFTRNAFLCEGDGHYLSISGDDAQIDYNDFGPKKQPGTMIAVSGAGSQVARRVWIHHNHFHDFENDGSNGAEMLRMGLLSSHRLSKGGAIVEHNLFVRCRGVNDLISNRSSGNTYRYNTFLDSTSAHLTVRQGDECAIYGNIFRNTEGIRLYGDRHHVYSNYFEGNYIGVAIGNGTIEISDAGDSAPPNSHDRPDGCVIAFNTFVENNTHYQMSRRTGGLGATNTIFANNLLVGGAVAAKIDGPNAGAMWSGNLVWKTGNPRDLPGEGHTVADPQLEQAPDGIKRPQPGSPVLGAAQGAFPAVAFDLDGQPRNGARSIGADEPGTDGRVARLLTPADVGPAAMPETTVAAANR